MLNVQNLELAGCTPTWTEHILKNGVNEENTSFSQFDNQHLSNFWLTPEKVKMRQSGVKGNFYAPFVGEGKRATAFSYPTSR